MTIIAERANDTRAKRRIDPAFRPHGGSSPHGKPGNLHIVRNEEEGQNNMEEPGLQ
jgi:hypothetical protein